MFASFGWIFFLLVGIVVVGLAAYLEITRRKRATAERRAKWKAHDDWLESSGVAPPAGGGQRMDRR